MLVVAKPPWPAFRLHDVASASLRVLFLECVLAGLEGSRFYMLSKGTDHMPMKRVSQKQPSILSRFQILVLKKRRRLLGLRPVLKSSPLAHYSSTTLIDNG